MTTAVTRQRSEHSSGRARETNGRTRRGVIGAVTVACFALPAALYLWVIQQYGVNVIRGDQWADVKLIKASYSGHLSLGTLWAQHNEDRIFL